MKQDKPSLIHRAFKRTTAALRRIMPRRIRRMAENRVFYAVFNTTRVTNDAYGWRPEENEEKGS